MKGFLKDPNEANRYLALDDGAPSPTGETGYMERQIVNDKPPDRRNIDLTKTVLLFHLVKFIASVFL